MQIWLAVNEPERRNIYPSQPVKFTVDAFPGKIFDGTVGKVRLNATMTQNVVTYTVEVNTDNKDGKPLALSHRQHDVRDRAQGERPDGAQRRVALQARGRAGRTRRQRRVRLNSGEAGRLGGQGGGCAEERRDRAARTTPKRP